MTDNTVDAHKMPLLDHLIELRSRLLKSVIALVLAFLVCFFFAEAIYGFLTEPLAEVLRDRREDPRMIFTALTEVFFTYVKVSFFAAAFVTCPVFLTQLWMFVAPGLYKKEQKALAPFLVATPVLFFIGGSLVYYVIFPLATRFLIGFEIFGEGDALDIDRKSVV
jgi:sec-independent protein translocase protein TatC